MQFILKNDRYDSQQINHKIIQVLEQKSDKYLLKKDDFVNIEAFLFDQLYFHGITTNNILFEQWKIRSKAIIIEDKAEIYKLEVKKEAGVKFLTAKEKKRILIKNPQPFKPKTKYGMYVRLLAIFIGGFFLENPLKNSKKVFLKRHISNVYPNTIYVKSMVINGEIATKYLQRHKVLSHWNQAQFLKHVGVKAKFFYFVHSGPKTKVEIFSAVELLENWHQYYQGLELNAKLNQTWIDTLSFFGDKLVIKSELKQEILQIEDIMKEALELSQTLISNCQKMRRALQNLLPTAKMIYSNFCKKV